MNMHFIYLGGGFNYAYALAVLSAVSVQRVYSIYLWCTVAPDGPHFDLVKDKVTLKMVDNPKFLSLERSKGDWQKASNLKDYFAYKILYEEGGIVCDLDTLSLKDATGLLGDYDLVTPLDAPKGSIEFDHGSSMFIGKEGSPVIKELLETTEHIFQQPWELRFGAAGPVLVTTVARKYPDKVWGSDFGFLGGVGGHEARILYEDTTKLPRECYILHLFSFAWKEQFARITPDYVKDKNSLYAKLARQVCFPVSEFDTKLDNWLKRGQHYRPVFDWLMTHECKHIMEIGTHNGQNGLMMIKAAAKRVAEADIHYHGFDLFEELTSEIQAKELSYPSPGTMEDVRKSMTSQTKAQIHLRPGDTKESLGFDFGKMDLIYIDGGHSPETIRSDWNNVKRFIKPSTVVFFDDYLPDREDMGCKFLIPELEGFNVGIFPQADSYKQADGSMLTSQLVMVTPKRLAAISDDEWLKHQESERRFWAYEKNVTYDTVKEQAYVSFLGLDKLRKGPYFDMQGKSVLDIGGGPVSLLLRCINFSKAVVLDPCKFDQWHLDKYKRNGIEFVNQKAEDYVPNQKFDEVWIYNVLQHVQDPEKVVGMAKKAAKLVRVFEWRDTPVSEGHPHTFTTEKLDALFGQKGNARAVNKDDMLYDLIHNTEEKIYWGEFGYSGEPKYVKVAKRNVQNVKVPDHMRFHIPAYVHLPCSEKYMGCAFTQKIVKLSKMLLSLGHEVYLYGAEGSDAPCTEFIQTHSLRDIRNAWGDTTDGTISELGYEWKKSEFRHDFNTPRKDATNQFYRKCIAEIDKRKRADDFLLVMQGAYHRPIADKVGLWLTVEPGIGYRGSYCRFKAFESAYLQNFTYGSMHPRESVNGNYYDRVIPNYFDPKDFEFRDKKEDFFFYIGRMIGRKGVLTAVETTKHIGAKLILAGQQDPEIDVKKLPYHCEFVGYLDPPERSSYLSRAKGVFVPTLYLEAFGGVNVEAQLSGTPVITTNFAVFPETVVHGVTGFCCDTLQDFVNAAKSVDSLDPKVIRKHAERYLMDNVKWEYEKWFKDLYQLYLSAVYPEIKGWHYLESNNGHK